MKCETCGKEYREPHDELQYRLEFLRRHKEGLSTELDISKAVWRGWIRDPEQDSRKKTAAKGGAT